MKNLIKIIHILFFWKNDKLFTDQCLKFVKHGNFQIIKTLEDVNFN